MRPVVVQMDTVCASYCQLRHRSSYGWAALGQKVIGEYIENQKRPD